MRPQLTTLLILFAIFSSNTAIAANADLTLAKLPVSAANQFVDSSNQHVVYMPVTISNNGLVAGERWTWTQDANGYLNPGGGMGGYIYNLNTGQYVANSIKDMVVTYITDTYYFGKSASLASLADGGGWKTYRCPLSGLSQNPNTGDYSNPSCVTIDNDYAPPGSYSPSAATWAVLVGTAVFRASYDQRVGSSQNGSTVVFRWNHTNEDTSGDSAYYYYRLNYPVLKADTSTQGTAAYLSSLLGFNATIENLLILTSSQGKDDFVFYNPNGGTTTAGEITEVLYPVDGSQTSPTFIHHDMGWKDSAGNLVTQFKINHNLDVLGSPGICNLADINGGGCSSVFPIDLTPLLQSFNPGVTINSSLVISFDRNYIVAACQDFSNSACVGNPYIYNIANQVVTNLSDAVLQQFGETVAPADTVFTFPYFQGSGTPYQGHEQIVASPNQKYLIWVVRKTDGSLGAYTLTFPTPSSQSCLPPNSQGQGHAYGRCKNDK